jgi:CRISPR/Cas system-associated exonuclease Cas4 (RecB family)
MINLLLYHHSDSLLKALSHQLIGSEHVTIITPNPAQADAARLRFGSVHNNFEAITIAKFLKDELIQLFGQERLENFRSKSELSLLLGSLWKIRRPNDSYEIFKRCFQLLTDFRSFTMNEAVLATIMENFDDQLAQSVIEFHNLLNQMDIIDEHRSYFLLAERLRLGDLPPLYPTNRTIIVWGFDFLTGSQVDLFNAMAIRNEIIFPFAAMAYAEAKDMDWIKWLSVQEENIINVDNPRAKVGLKTFVFPKNYLAKSLKSIKTTFFADKKMDIILGCKNLTDDFVSELPFSEYSFKVGINIFDEKLKALKLQIKDLIKGDELVLFASIMQMLDDYAKRCVAQQDFRLLKTISVLKETIIEWNELTDNNEMLGEFDWSIIFDAVSLDLPRSSLFNPGTDEALELKTLKNFEQATAIDVRLLCVTSDYDAIKGSVIQYAEKVEQYLISIGPIRRTELEFLVLKAKLLELLVDENVYLVIENGIIERDLGWNSVVNCFELEYLNLPAYAPATKSFLNPVKESTYQLDSISALKLQSYLDCPRKFYLSYVLRQRPIIELPNQLNLMQLGLIEHRVIEEYLKRHTSYQELELDRLITQVLDSFQIEKQILIQRLEEYSLEVKAYCSEIIKELVVLNNFLGLHFAFEKKLDGLQPLKVQGSIDCFAQNENTTLVFDFKRGSGSIPSQVGLKNFEKIQLWFYLNNLKKAAVYKSEKRLIWGYVNLSDLESSLIYCSDPLLIDQLKQLNLKLFTKLYSFDESYYQLLEDYAIFEQDSIHALASENLYLSRPKDETICRFCEVANICPRGQEVTHVQC